MNRLTALLVTLLAIPSFIHGQNDTPRWEVFGGYSYLRVENEAGAHGFEISFTGNANRWFGFVAGHSAHDRSVSFTTPSPKT